MMEYAGFKWISEQTGITPVQPFRVISRIGPVRKTHHRDHEGVTEEVYKPQLRPDATIPAHLTFALKYEIIHLEFLSRLFHAIDPAIIAAWVKGEPTGIFARRAGFFYEWLTGKRLDVPDAGGNYVLALPENICLTAGRAVNVPAQKSSCAVRSG